MTKKTAKMLAMNRDPAWIRRMAELEDGGFVSVGGWVTDIARINAPLEDGRTRSRFGRFLLLAQREKRLRRRRSPGLPGFWGVRRTIWTSLRACRLRGMMTPGRREPNLSFMQRLAAPLAAGDEAPAPERG